MKKVYLILLTVSLTFGAMAQERLTATAEQAKVKFFPNPATSVINFEFSKIATDKSFTLQIYSFIGKKVTEVVINSAKTTLTLDNFYRGVYIFQLRDKTGRIVDSGKFQVAK